MIGMNALRKYWDKLDDVDRKYVTFLAARLAEDRDRYATRDGWYRVRDAAEYANCSDSTITAAIRNGYLEASMPYGYKTHRIRKDDLDRWLSGRRPRACRDDASVGPTTDDEEDAA